MQTTKNLIKCYYDSFNQQNMETFLSLLDQNVIHDINQNGVEIGKDKFSMFMERMNRCYKENVRDLLIIVSEDGTHAAVEFIVDGSYNVTDKGLPEAKGQKYSLPGGAFFNIKNGKIIRITNYYNLKEWLRQINDQT